MNLCSAPTLGEDVIRKFVISALDASIIAITVSLVKTHVYRTVGFTFALGTISWLLVVPCILPMMGRCRNRHV